VEKSPRTRRPAPRAMLGAARYSIVEKKPPLIYHQKKGGKWRC